MVFLELERVSIFSVKLINIIFHEVLIEQTANLLLIIVFSGFFVA
uniref:Uncharacterized protein n=1 Tax=Bartonella rochalimae ATCC BAA-1498 TaxID=685782 RepID=E6YL47_9HYPH|nr:hypothetical protein BARRO_30166 [Bartonella rochalimae ATCC BAA-1498]